MIRQLVHFEIMSIDFVINIGTVISTVVGFAGLIITLWYNAKQAREQQDRQWQHEQERAKTKDDDERAALRGALTAELQAMLLTIQVFLDEYAEEEKRKELVPLPPVPVDAELSTAIYRAVLPRITMLSALEIGALTSAYANFIRNVGDWTGLEHLDNPEYYIQRADLYIRSVKIISRKIKIALKTLEEHKEKAGTL